MERYFVRGCDVYREDGADGVFVRGFMRPVAAYAFAERLNRQIELFEIRETERQHLETACAALG